MTITTSPHEIGPDADAGLTLVEILVVVAILGLGLVLGSTSWVHWQESRRLANAAEKISLLLRDAKTQARKTGSVISVRVDSAARTFDAVSMHRSVLLPNEVNINATLAQLDGSPSIEMLPDGSSTGGEIELSQPGLPAVKIAVSWIDGEIRNGE